MHHQMYIVLLIIRALTVKAESTSDLILNPVDSQI